MLLCAQLGTGILFHLPSKAVNNTQAYVDVVTPQFDHEDGDVLIKVACCRPPNFVALPHSQIPFFFSSKYWSLNSTIAYDWGESNG